MSHVEPSKHPFISNRFYDVLKFIATIVLPASGGFYFGLSEIWGLPFGAQIVGTITVLDTFLGAVLLITSARYNKSDAKYDGSLVVDTAASTARLEVDEIDSVADKDTLTLKVTAPTSTVE